MAVKWMHRVWDGGKKWSGSKLLVALALADFANDAGYLWPSIATIARKCRLSERQAQRIIHELVADGAIEIARHGDGRGNTTFYRIKDVGDVTVTEEKDDISVTLRNAETLKRVTSSAQRVTSSAQKGDTAMSPDPLVDPSIDPSLDPSGGDDRNSSRARAAPPGTEPTHPPQKKQPQVLRSPVPTNKPPVVIDSPYLSGAPFNQEGYIPAGQGTNPVQVYYERFSIRNNRARLTAPLEEDLARLCPDLAKLRDVVTAYSQHLNYQPGNIKLIVEWYQNGIPDRSGNGRIANQTNGYTNSRPRSKVEESLAAVDRVFARLEAEGVDLDSGEIIDAEVFYGTQ